LLKRQLEHYRRDDRGILRQVATLDGIQLNDLEIRKDKVMGGHFHKNTTEIFYVLSGAISLWSYMRGEKEARHTEFPKGSVFVIQPFEWHSIEAIRRSRLIVLLSEPYNADNPDIHDGGL